MFVFWVVAKGGWTIIIEEDKLNTVMSLVLVVFGKKPKTRFCKNNKQINTRPCRLSDRYNISDSNALRNLLVLMQISTSVLPTLTAVTSMQCVAIRLDRTHARVKQDLPAMEKLAPVSCCGNVKIDFQNDVNVILCRSICYIRSVHGKISRKKEREKKKRKKDGHDINDKKFQFK